MNVKQMAEAVLYMAALPLEANVQFIMVISDHDTVHRRRLSAFRLLLLRGRMPRHRWRAVPWLILVCCLARWGDAQANPPIKKPLAVSANFRYFKDSSDAPVVLSGSQTWNTLQDWSTGGLPTAMDFDAFVRFLTAHGHNFT